MIQKKGRGSRAKWGKPKNLGSEVNTKGDEMYPFLREDGKLFFASNGHQGMGGLDIFKADMTGNADEETYEWGEVENLKHPINSPADDFGLIYQGADEERGYFSSSREGGRGKDDIYSFKVPPLKFVLNVHAMNKESKKPLDSVKVTVTGSDGKSFTKTTSSNGMASFKEQARDRIIKKGNTYKIKANKEGFLAATGQISTVGYEESRVFNHEAELQPADTGKVIQLPEVRYPVDKTELLVNDKVNSKDSLDFLYNVLKENPKLKIELQAHTDARASDEYNQKLSQGRAETCVEYLEQKGIDSARMVPKGYGESKPRIPMEEIEKMQTEEEKEAAHQKNRRTVFKVIGRNYVPDESGDEKEKGKNDEGEGPGEGGGSEENGEDGENDEGEDQGTSPGSEGDDDASDG
jgi:peptidoglycan-associated lipoprotein